MPVDAHQAMARWHHDQQSLADLARWRATGVDVTALFEHFDDLIGCYARQCGPGTRPPMVPVWYWHDVNQLDPVGVSP